VVVLASCTEKPLAEVDPSLLEGIALKLLQLGDAVSTLKHRISER
jgi:hypothetical protein